MSLDLFLEPMGLSCQAGAGSSTVLVLTMVFGWLLLHRQSVRPSISLLTRQGMQTLQAPSGLALPALPARELVFNQ